jgi:hypothetical protein
MKVVPKRNFRLYGRQFVSHVLPAVIKPARTLWHEVFGFLFLCLAVIIGFSAARFYFGPDYTGGPGGLLRLLMSAFCVVLFSIYGISSFLRARKISRS